MTPVLCDRCQVCEGSRVSTRALSDGIPLSGFIAHRKECR